MNIYIISWLGGPLREKRKALHNKQIAHFKATMPDSTITVLAMDYKEEDQHPGVDYILACKQSPAQARNHLLREFYASNDQLGLFCDDDCIIDERFWGGTRLLEDLSNKDHTFFDLLEPVYPRMQPTHATYYGKEQYRHFNVFEPKRKIKTSLFIMRNLKQAHGKEIFFDETLPEQEDMEFSLRLNKEGYGVYKFANLVADDLGSSCSSLMLDLHGDQNQASDRKNALYDEIESKYTGVTTRNKKVVKRSYSWIIEWDKKLTTKRTNYTITRNEELKQSPTGLFEW